MDEKGATRPETGTERKIGAWLLAIALVGLLSLAAVSLFWLRGGEQTAVVPTTASPVASAATQPASPVPTETVMPSATAVAPATSTPTATPTPSPTPIPLPVWNNLPDDATARLADQWAVGVMLPDQTNTGTWRYQPDSFIRPIALESDGQMAYLLDAGRVLALDLTQPAAAAVMLQPDDIVADVRVLEPLDLALTADALRVLDRAGDVYRMDLASQTWSLDRYDRPVEASSGHYFVAIDTADHPPPDAAEAADPYLLETNYKFVTQYGAALPSAWRLPDQRAVDVSAVGDRVYVLQRELHDTQGQVTQYRYTASVPGFRTRFPIDRPRQLVATDTAVFVLDQDGARLLAFDPQSGALTGITQLPAGEQISAFWADTAGQTLILAGRDRLYFPGQPERLAAIAGGTPLSGPQPHDPEFLAGLTDLRVPIGGSNITFRDFQMPGAPRHYRLGIHYGSDFYWQPGTQVLAAGDGVVVRADVDYAPPTAVDLGRWWSETQARGFTSDDILNSYLGRQIIIEHANGLTSRYAHLSEIAPEVEVGTAVARGQVIGAVGNSGSPASLDGPTSDAHLHFELWSGDHYVGQFLRPIEAREWIEQILGKG